MPGRDAGVSDSAVAVSVIMGVYNGAEHLREALESILGQTFADFELIVIDDASTDDTPAILSRYAFRDRRIRLFTNDRNLGLTKTLNRGLELATGTFIARQDADDVSMPGRLARQVSFLRSKPKVEVVGSAYRVIDHQGRPGPVIRPPGSDTAIRWNMLFHNAFCHSSVMFRNHTDADARCRYDERLALGQDYDLWSRLLRQGEGRNLGKALVCLRRHEQRLSVNRRQDQQQLAAGVALQNLQELMPDHDWALDEVDALRHLIAAFPRDLGERELRQCHFLLEILSRLRERDGVDEREIHFIRVRWLFRMLLASGRLTGGEVWFQRELVQAFRHRPVVTFAGLSKMIFRRALFGLKR